MRSYNKSVYKHYIGDNGEKANWVERMRSTQCVGDCAILGEAALSQPGSARVFPLRKKANPAILRIKMI